LLLPLLALVDPIAGLRIYNHNFSERFFKEFFDFDCDFYAIEGIAIQQFMGEIHEIEKRSEVIDLMLAVEMLCPKIPLRSH